MKRVQTNVALDELRGKLAPKRTLEYANNDNPAFDAPEGRQYARNYKNCIVLCKRSSTGNQYFQVKTKTATKISAATKLQMALFGGATAMSAYVFKTAALRQHVEGAYAIAKSAGITEAKSAKAYLIETLRVGLAAKSPIISVYASDGTHSDSIALQNPWCYTGQQGGQEVKVGNAILVKFWAQLASKPILFTVASMKGVAHGGATHAEDDTFAQIISRGRYNVLGLEVEATGEHRVKLGNSYVVYDNNGNMYAAVSGSMVNDPTALGASITTYYLSDDNSVMPFSD